MAINKLLMVKHSEYVTCLFEPFGKKNILKVVVETITLNNYENQTEADGKGAIIENLQKKIRRLELDLEKRNDVKNTKDDHGKLMQILFLQQTKDEIVRWEESKRWQARMEKVKTSLKEKERDNESLSKQLGTLKDLYGRLEQEKAALQKKLKARGVTADQVVGVRANDMERQIEELKKKNSELETQIVTINCLLRDLEALQMTFRDDLYSPLEPTSLSL
ncbi:hypothetical protein CCH79_00011842 [Gambusia affinis]|uniref:Uncharacterized protein n=1 Tax=Gambusia affinis TaxID=33528 RepID=A0A315VN18_GAMAF|nr:hypothetical protein CCH79_00011842 [Gambusia affinis]